MSSKTGSTESVELMDGQGQGKSSNAVKRKQREERKTLVSINDAILMLGCTKVEIKRWIDRNLIPVAQMKSFRKWGMSLETPLFDPEIIADLAPLTTEWRKEDAAIRAEKRKRTVSKTAGVARVGPRIVSMMKTFPEFDGFAIHGKVEKGYANCSFPIRISLQIGENRHSINVLIDSTVLIDACILSEISVFPMPTGIAKTEMQTKVAGFFKRQLEQKQSAIESLPASCYGNLFRLLKSEEVNEKTLEFCLKQTEDDFLSLSGRRFEEKNFTKNLHKNAVGLEKWVKTHIEQNHVMEVTRISQFSDFFPKSRTMERKFVFLAGPTNSGKTHAGFEYLAKAEKGAYLAPLRLMALEGHERMKEMGLPCHLLTGEEHIVETGAEHVSSTIEMADFRQEIDVALIDEVQMIQDENRGWAWSSAIIGIPARTVVMTGSIDALPYIRLALSMTGESLEVREFERLSPLELGALIKMEEVSKGDAVIAFSRMDVHRLKMELQSRGHSVAVIYGALGPEVRREESRRFKSGEAEILVATDAIGMGLNLPVRRVVFSSLTKFDGNCRRSLNHSEIRQIGGRAGRFGLHEKGVVSVLEGLGCGINPVRDALLSHPRMDKVSRLWVSPPWEAVERLSQEKNETNLSKLLTVLRQALEYDPRLKNRNLDDVMEIAKIADQSNLSLREKFRYMGVPVDFRDPEALSRLHKWMKGHGKGQLNRCPEMSKQPRVIDDNDLQRIEIKHKTIVTYLWLSMRWPEVFCDEVAAREMLKTLNSLILSALKSKHLHRTCSKCHCQLSFRHVYPICDRCHHDRSYDFW